MRRDLILVTLGHWRVKYRIFDKTHLIVSQWVVLVYKQLDDKLQVSSGSQLARGKAPNQKLIETKSESNCLSVTQRLIYIYSRKSSVSVVYS